MIPTELLSKLMDDIVHNPLEIRTGDAVNLSMYEFAIYIDSLSKQKREIGSEFEKHVKKKPPADPFKDIIEEKK